MALSINDKKWEFTPDNAGLFQLDTEDTYLDRDIYIDIPEGEVGSTGGNVTGTNVTFSTTDNGISVTGSGKGVVIEPGWVEVGNASDSSLTRFIEGVTLSAPTSGTRSFFITVPDLPGGTKTFTVKVSSTGSAWVE